MKKTIDHDPRELPHRAWKIVAVVTVAVTIAILIPIGLGIRWAVEGMPIEIIALFFGLMMGACGGFFLGRWDAIRQFRTPGKDG